MNTQINITENGTTTLATAGKYCDRNIDVNVEVDSFDADGFVQGTIEGEFVSDKVTSLRLGAFANCPNLTYVSLPNCTTFNGFRQFSGCRKITALELPKLETIPDGNQNFTYMEAVTEISLPSLTKINGSASTFANCLNVRKINMPRLSGSTIGGSCFDNEYRLATLVLGGDTLNPLAHTSAFRNAGASVTGGLKIYVPDDLVDSYKIATNWTAFADKIKPMSELEE